MSITARPLATQTSPPTTTSSSAYPTTSISCNLVNLSLRLLPTSCSSLWSWAPPISTAHAISLYRFYSEFNSEESICAPLGGQPGADLDLHCGLKYNGYACPAAFSNVGTYRTSRPTSNRITYYHTTTCCPNNDPPLTLHPTLNICHASLTQNGEAQFTKPIIYNNVTTTVSSPEITQIDYHAKFFIVTNETSPLTPYNWSAISALSVHPSAISAISTSSSDSDPYYTPYTTSYTPPPASTAGIAIGFTIAILGLALGYYLVWKKGLIEKITSLWETPELDGAPVAKQQTKAELSGETVLEISSEPIHEMQDTSKPVEIGVTEENCLARHDEPGRYNM